MEVDESWDEDVWSDAECGSICLCFNSFSPSSISFIAYCNPFFVSVCCVLSRYCVSNFSFDHPWVRSKREIMGTGRSRRDDTSEQRDCIDKRQSNSDKIR